MLLTAEQRRVFAEYCRSEAETLKAMSEHLKKLDAGDFLVNQMRLRSIAFRTVQIDMEVEREEMVVRSEDTGEAGGA